MFTLHPGGTQPRIIDLLKLAPAADREGAP